MTCDQLFTDSDLDGEICDLSVHFSNVIAIMTISNKKFLLFHFYTNCTIFIGFKQSNGTLYI